MEMHARNTSDSDEDSERKEESRRESIHPPREYLSSHERNVDRNMDNKGLFDEASDGNEEHVIGNWRKGNPCCKVAKNLAELCSCSSVLWKAELESDEIGYLAEAVSKQRVEGVARPLLTADSK